jgi:hypothetical protein
MASANREPGVEFQASAFSGRHPLGVALVRMSSWHVFQKSLVTVQGNLRGETGILETDGSVRGPVGRGKEWNHRFHFNQSLRQFVANPETYGCFVYDPERVARVAAIAERIRASGAEARFFVTPIHAEQQELIHALGLGAEFERFKRDLAAEIAAEPGARGAPWPLWDFTGYGPQNTEPVPPNPGGRMRWYWESSHSTRALGSLVLSRMLAPDGPERYADGFGAQLRPGNVDAQLVAQREERQAWLARAPGARRSIQRLADRHRVTARAACARVAAERRLRTQERPIF